ncbi:hypothetical protein EC843_1185 [Buttiauxella sp. JUb87]|nr:hypothetical protein EC843_1185 [Buttiauxella sp. JUb87]
MAGCLYYRHEKRLQWTGGKGTDTLKDDPMSGHVLSSGRAKAVR